MIRKLIFFTLSVILLVQCNSVKESEWKLAWADEFDYSGAPADTIWDYETGYIRNNELQKYTKEAENVEVRDGACVITCRMEEDSTITSASINTFGKKHIRYGRVEVRARIPSSLGTWPAIWMLGTNKAKVGWPACGELDIMEHVGYDPEKIHANIHTQAYNHVKGTNKGNTIEVEAPWEDFHIYALNWTHEKIDFFYDDSLYFTYTNDMKEDPATWPFDQPFYLLINLAYGGGWGGQQGVDVSSLPVEYLVDYVRVYEAR